MENVISARRLRKSVLNSVGEVDLNLYNLNKPSSHKDKVLKYTNTNTKKEDIKISNFKTKILVKLFICSVILFTILLSKMFFLEEIKSNTTVVRWYNHYVTHFSRGCILGKFEYRVGKLDAVIGNIVPNKIKEITTQKYLNSIKPYILSFDLKTTFKSILNLESSKNKQEVVIESQSIKTISTGGNYLNAEVKEEVLDGIGGAEPLEEKTEEAMSSISIMDMDVEYIKSKNISIIVPVKGVITSRYGVRQQVFNGVDPYHTGIDIANKKGTEILSATKGIVTKVEYNNKYYGNLVEVTENGVIFKYGHMDSINVKQGSVISQKDRIGLMGSTGMSTGNHLHFEIRVNDRSVNPEELLRF